MSKKEKLLSKLAEIKKEIAKFEKSLQKLIKKSAGKKEETPVVNTKKYEEKTIFKRGANAISKKKSGK